MKNISSAILGFFGTLTLIFGTGTGIIVMFSEGLGGVLIIIVSAMAGAIMLGICSVICEQVTINTKLDLIMESMGLEMPVEGDEESAV